MKISATHTARLLGAGLRALLVLTVVTGIVYPLVITGVAQGLFPGKANGSRIEADGEVVGSSLIGQAYDLPLGDGRETPEPDLRWFQGRPQNGLGTNSVNTRYDLILSGATNRSADNAELVRWVEEAKAAVVRDNSVPGRPVRPSDVPPDAVTSSGSGLDPHISPEYAGLQVRRVAERNGLPVARVQELVDAHTTPRTLGFIGEPRVNVLELNIALRELRQT
ncbi:potassium-transporting ATPase subunit C [Streptomyces ardesiacus]|uniref:potassium-transporting ATPase subunit C n=1 Tax=Streptomyces TaxID=1883 RepID=UPI0004C0A1B6|nr:MULTISPECIES: potassium-transporting ATPase subunit C [unclassified Streptomyces]KOU02511.1 potassium-transporting ATPase subunit C [Streptomyces sp. NRRL F-4711]KOX30191.1 potassium-transporting ATPase subunit C [Streptomyces sp. NRRL F-4707]